jgi:hypothetical protein
LVRHCINNHRPRRMRTVQYQQKQYQSHILRLNKGQNHYQSHISCLKTGQNKYFQFKRTPSSLRISPYIYMSNDCPNRVKPVRRPFIILPSLPAVKTNNSFPFFLFSLPPILSVSCSLKCAGTACELNPSIPNKTKLKLTRVIESLMNDQV